MHLRHRFGYVVVALTLSLSLRAADPVWWQVRSQNFILFTDTSEAKGLRLLTDLEARHAEMADVFGGIPARPFPVEVFLFEKAADFSETIPKVPAGTEFNKSAYLVRGPDRVFVVAKDKSPDDIANDAGHALGHVFFERLAWWRPFWLSEGAAEYFRKVSRSPDTKAVSEKEGFSASDLLKIVPSAGYDDDAPPTAFRVQSHRLLRVLLQGYRAEFRDHLKVLKTAEGAKARPNVPVDSLQASLSDYVETRITATTVPALDSREVSPAAVAIHRGDLLLAAGKTSDAAAWYNGDSTQARAARAILTRFSRSGTEPIRALARASQDLSGDGLVQLHFGSIETQTRSDLELQVRALERAIQLLPQSGRAPANLARVRTLLGEGDKALPLLDQAIELEPEFTDQFLLLRAEAYLSLSRFDDANATAELAAASPHLDRSIKYEDKAADIARRIGSIRREADSRRADQIRSEVAATAAKREPPPPPPAPPPPQRFGDIQYELQTRTPTEVLNADLPFYPDALIQRGAAGAITLQATIGVDGRVAKAAISNSQLPEMNAATLEAVKKWAFKPATSSGRAAAFDVRIIIRFRVQ